jgi:hypothetical protein
MNEPNADKNRLRVPAGVTPQGAVMDIMEAQAKALLAIPELLNAILGEMSVIALYLEKKGKAEGLLTDEDLEGGDNAA